MTVAREPIPPGRVSGIRGRWQAPALMWLTRIVLVIALAGGLLAGHLGDVLATAAVATIIAIPILRVAWLIVRWRQERDTRFVIAGLALLATVAVGGLLAALGVG